jgi:ATP-dependent Clp protease ATP-binding subunit ClpC
VGYEDGGQLSEKVRRHPYSVILFDEIEKAHTDVFNILLQILEDGQVTDAQGRKVSFKNTIIIMTSNAGAQRIVEPKHLGFGVVEDGEEDYQKMKDGVMEEVKRLFKPEFINRIDEILVFRMLTKDDIKEIVKIMLDSLGERTKSQLNLTLTVTEEAVVHLAESGFDKNYGARPVRRGIQTQIEDELAEKILQGEIAPGDHVQVDYREEKMVFSKL